MSPNTNLHQGKPHKDDALGLDPHEPGKDRFGNDVTPEGNDKTWTGGFYVGTNPRVKIQCRAARRGTNNKTRCRGTALRGKLLCRVHGGHQQREMCIATIRHGRYSKYIDAPSVAIDDEDLLDLRHQVALLDQLVHRQASLAKEHDTPEFRDKALKLFETVKEHILDEDVAKAQSVMDKLGKLLEHGASESATYKNLADTTVRMHRAVAETWQVRFKGSEMISRARFDMLLMDIISTIGSVVTDGDLAFELVKQIRARVAPPEDRIADYDRERVETDG